MSFAKESILFVLFIIVPAVVFRRFYFSQSFSKQYSTTSLFQLIVVSVPIGLAMNFLAAWIGNVFRSDSQIEFVDIVQCLTQEFDTVKYLGVTTDQIFYFWVLVCLYSATVGLVALKTVRFFRLDRRLKALRFGNYWHYFFMGEISHFSEVSGAQYSSNGTVSNQFRKLSMIVEVGETPFLFKGILVDYQLDHKTGNLGSIVLSHAVKRPLNVAGEKLTTDEIVSKSGAYFLTNTHSNDVILEGHHLLLEASEFKLLEITHVSMAMVMKIFNRDFPLQRLGNALSFLALVMSLTFTLISIQYFLDESGVSSRTVILGLAFWLVGLIVARMSKGR